MLLPFFYVGAEELNSRPQGYPACTSPSQPSPQPQNIFLTTCSACLISPRNSRCETEALQPKVLPTTKTGSPRQAVMTSPKRKLQRQHKRLNALLISLYCWEPHPLKVGQAGKGTNRVSSYTQTTLLPPPRPMTLQGRPRVGQNTPQTTEGSKGSP